MSTVIEIKGLGHVPSFKNSKMIARGRLITLPKRQKWMERAIRLIASQLRYASVIAGGATSTGRSPLSLTVSLPLDDSCDWIPEIRVVRQRVPAGQEGARVIIERIS